MCQSTAWVHRGCKLQVCGACGVTDCQLCALQSPVFGDAAQNGSLHTLTCPFATHVAPGEICPAAPPLGAVPPCLVSAVLPESMYSISGLLPMSCSVSFSTPRICLRSEAHIRLCFATTLAVYEEVSVNPIASTLAVCEEIPVNPMLVHSLLLKL